MTEETIPPLKTMPDRRAWSRRLRSLALCALSLGLITLFLKFYSPVPVVLIGPARVKPQIAINRYRVLLLSPDGSLWTWKDGVKFHRLGTDSDRKLIALRNSGFTAVKIDGTLWQWEDSWGEKRAPHQLSRTSNWVALATADADFAALRSDGTLWAWKGDLVQLDKSTNWLKIAAGNDHVAGLRRDGTLWVWMAPFKETNGIAQFGVESHWTDVCSSGNGFMAKKNDGSCWRGELSSSGLIIQPRRQIPLAWGEMVSIKEIEGWNSVAFHCNILGISNDGTLRGFGLNLGGMLGKGPRGVQTGPVQIGRRYDWVVVGADGWVAVGLTADGTVWAWGTRMDESPSMKKAKLMAAIGLRQVGINIFPIDVRNRPARMVQFRSQAPEY